MPKKLVDRIREAEKSEHRVAPPDEPCAGELITNDPQLGLVSNYITRTTGSPVWKNTQAQYLPIGETMWARLREELPKAKRFIFMEYFILEEGEMWEPIFEILKQKAAEGVEVRFMYDDLGSIMTLPVNYDVQLRNAGIQCAVFNPFKPHLNATMNYRDHRKITVIDGNVGFCGGINIADEYINAYEKHGHWKDTGVRVTGEAAWNFTAMFLEFWHAYRPESANEPLDAFHPHAYHPAPFAGEGWVQPFSDSPLDGEAVSAGVYIDILAQARDYVYIFTPYLIIDDVMQAALCAAAKRGVDVRIVTPGVPDKKVVLPAQGAWSA